MIIDFSNQKLYNKKYIPLLRNKKRYIFLMGGAWSWKSVFQAQKEIILSFKPWNKLLVVRKVKDTHKDSTYAELINIIEQWNLEKYFNILKSPLEITNKLTWSNIIFRGMDDPEKIKSVQWVNRIRIEEATEMMEQDFNQLDLRLRWLKEMQITCTYNPINKEHWLYKFRSKWNNKNVELLHSTYLDNRFIDKKYKEVMERLKEQNPEYYKIYALWEWWTRQGLVFEKQPIKIDNVSEARLLWYWLDFWFTNDPTALVGIYKRNQWYILDEIIYRTWLTNSDIINIMKQEWINTEDTIMADSAEPKSIEEIYRSWFNIKPAVKWKDSIIHWIDFMKSLNLYITKRSVNGIKEFENYIWWKDKNWKSLNKPVDANNHFIDATRYWINSLINNKKEFEIVFW